MTTYWIIDTQPQTIAAGYPNGRPVHIGTSKHLNAADILEQINQAADRGKPWQSILVLKSMGDHFRIDILSDRSSYSISNNWLRAMFPPRADQINKRRRRYEDTIGPSEIAIIKRYLPLFEL